jgi:hypothetical protein
VDLDPGVKQLWLLLPSLALALALARAPALALCCFARAGACAGSGTGPAALSALLPEWLWLPLPASTVSCGGGYIGLVACDNLVVVLFFSFSFDHHAPPCCPLREIKNIIAGRSSSDARSVIGAGASRSRSVGAARSCASAWQLGRYHIQDGNQASRYAQPPAQRAEQQHDMVHSCTLGLDACKKDGRGRLLRSLAIAYVLFSLNAGKIVYTFVA